MDYSIIRIQNGIDLTGNYFRVKSEYVYTVHSLSVVTIFICIYKVRF